MPVGGVGLRLPCPRVAAEGCPPPAVCGLSTPRTSKGVHVTLHQELLAAVAAELRRSHGVSEHDLARAVVAAAGRHLEVTAGPVAVEAHLESAVDVRRLGRWLAGKPPCSFCAEGRWHIWHNNGDFV